MFGCMALHLTSTGYEPNVPNVPNADVSTNANMGTSGARFVPTVDSTHDDDDPNSHMSDIPLQLPASAIFALNDKSSTAGNQRWCTMNGHDGGPF